MATQNKGNNTSDIKVLSDYFWKVSDLLAVIHLTDKKKLHVRTTLASKQEQVSVCIYLGNTFQRKHVDKV